MALFFFDLGGRQSLRDSEGIELVSAEEAEAEAIRALPGLLQEMTAHGHGDRFGESLSVRDDHGQILVNVAMSVRVTR